MVELLKMPGVTYCEFKKGSTIIQQDEKVEYVYYLTGGTCYRMKITEKGDEIIFGIKEPNQRIYSLIGVLVVFGDGFTDSRFVAKTTCYCYKIPKKVLLHYISDKPDILMQLLKMAMMEYRRLSLMFQARQKGKIGNWFCALLLAGAKDINGKLWANKAYSNNAEVSRLLGIHKVTVAKIIKKLKEDGIINKCKEGIEIIDQEQLMNYANFECNLKY